MEKPLPIFRNSKLERTQHRTEKTAAVNITFKKLAVHPTTHKDYNVLNQFEENESSMAMNEWLALIFVIFILSQVLFLMNMIRAFIVKRKSL
jgi:hypothetical protein